MFVGRSEESGFDVCWLVYLSKSFPRRQELVATVLSPTPRVQHKHFHH
jgi:hypothetical protein